MFSGSFRSPYHVTRAEDGREASDRRPEENVAITVPLCYGGVAALL